MSHTSTLLFIGDSITDGNRGRNNDPNHILGHGFVFMIAGRLGLELGGEAPLVVNRGVSGDRASDLYGRWNEDCLAVKPDIVSILVGVNDALAVVAGDDRGASDRFERAYGHLLEETRLALPQARIVLCEPFTLRTPATEDRWAAWEPKMAEYRRTVRSLADRHRAVFVPLQDLFDAACSRGPAEFWLWDGVHPTAAGHELIARRWMDRVWSPSQAR
ncbi:SGNH/GDSL hydrolase family protein [Paenibacillus spiritus]|uniref:SGNH/GDSL hydrolase family protein n=1 Tax=Paenibacillus spiritus TaxID=2496557 RepID=A0A5J5FV26_9BACL|nr:SGNH/GDSL hydrolase family protein [Paenibacillus spiritus]KAA8997188.1 SGNH/GDSL hydrolase family protein [Paenibacillus spiritus]